LRTISKSVEEAAFNFKMAYNEVESVIESYALTIQQNVETLSVENDNCYDDVVVNEHGNDDNENILSDQVNVSDVTEPTLNMTTESIAEVRTEELVLNSQLLMNTPVMESAQNNSENQLNTAGIIADFDEITSKDIKNIQKEDLTHFL